MGEAKRLTDAAVDAAKPVPGRVLVLKDRGPDSVPGLVLRVSSRGKLWAVWYRVKATGAKGLWSLDRYDDGCTLAQARERAREIRKQAKQGFHPKQVELDAQAAEREARAAVVSVVDVVSRWLTHRKVAGEGRHGPLAASASREYQRCLDTYIAEDPIASRPAGTLPKHEAMTFLDRLVVERGPGIARSVHRMMRASFAWAERMEMISEDKLAGLRVTKAKARERTLSDAELAVYWQALDQAPALPAAVLRLQALTAVRFPSELLSARWSDVDLKAKRWALPAATRKGGVAHVLPLSTVAVRLLESLEAIQHDGPRAGRKPKAPADPKGRVFGPVNVRGQVDWWFGKAEETVRAKCRTDAFVPHDIRRSVATGIVRLGFGSAGTADAILGHKLQGVAAVYIHAMPLMEMERALEKWGRHVERIVGGKPADVVPITG